MQRIISHIEYLLDCHDCVTIPGFGAFIKAICPASIDAESGVIYPPHRSLTFNSELTFDDGLLASSYSRAENQPFTSASASLSKDIELLKSTLKFQPKVDLGCIGTMSLDNGHYIFVPSDSIFTDFGLPIATVSPIAEEVGTDEPVILAAPDRFTRTLQGMMKYAAMFVVLLTIGIVLSTPMSDDARYEVVKASMSPIDAIVHTDDSAINTYDLDGAPAFMIADPATKVDDTMSSSSSTDRFCLIVASLASRQLADQFIADNPTLTLGVIESNGRYRVYAATGPTIDSVMSQKLLASFPDAWPCQL